MSRRIVNPKCRTCAHMANNRCTAKSFRVCPLATIQFAFIQFDKTVKAQCGDRPCQVLVASVLTNAVMDVLHMYRPSGQSNAKEALRFIHDCNREKSCELIGLNYEWFLETAETFIDAVKRAGLKSVRKTRKEQE